MTWPLAFLAALMPWQPPASLSFSAASFNISRIGRRWPPNKGEAPYRQAHGGQGPRDREEIPPENPQLARREVPQLRLKLRPRPLAEGLPAAALDFRFTANRTR